jgi:sugar/nucleoside kinase (ribokinase family)
MRILCAGLSTVDLVQRVARLPGVDEKVQSESVEVAAGGPAANAAVTAAALGSPWGVDVVLLSAVGAHPLGDLIRADLAAHGVTLIDATPDRTTPPPVSAVTVLSGTGQRTIVSRNAGAETIPPPAGDLPAADLTLVDGHHPALAMAAARGARRLLVDAGSWRPIFTEIFPHADVVACSADFRHPSATSTEATADGRRVADRTDSTDGTDSTDRAGIADGTDSTDQTDSAEGKDLAAASAAVSASGTAQDAATAAAVNAPHVIVTHGPAPVRWFSARPAGAPGRSGSPRRLTRAGFTRGEIEVPPVAAVDTSGAGDAFHGALALSLAQGQELTTAIEYAIRAAGVRVAHAGPRDWLTHL